MTISDEIKGFLDNQIAYYITEAQSYKEMAQEYSPKVDSVQDTAFGIIIGCIYSSFLQALLQPEACYKLGRHTGIHRNNHDKC